MPQSRGIGWRAVFAVAVAVRLAQAALLQTQYVADEFWQGPEVAHALAFGRGGSTWEWRPDVALRGAAAAWLYALAQWAAARSAVVVGPPSWAVLWAPYVVHVLAMAVADVAVAAWAARWVGPSPADVATALALQWSAWFAWYAGLRPLSNAWELVAVCVVGAVLPWRAGDSQRGRAAAAAAAAAGFLLRPASGVLWAAWLSAYLASACPDRARFVTRIAVPVGGALLALSTVIDAAFYGRWTVVPANFFAWNVLHGVGAFYGTQPWHWYLTAGLPAVLGPLLPMAVLGALAPGAGLGANGRARPPLAVWAVLAVTVAAYSLQPHKEFRFVICVLPFAVLASARFVRLLAARRPRAARAVLGVAVAVQLAAGLFFGLAHQRGPISVAQRLRQLADAGPLAADFLTPCHGAPAHSYVHDARAQLRFLDCSPLAPPPGEADAFFRDPERAFAARPALAAAAGGGATRALVMYEPMYAALRPQLDALGCVHVERYFHTFFPEDARYSRELLLVLCATNSP